MGLRERKNVDLIACPSCGRAEIDVIDGRPAGAGRVRRPRDPAAGRGDGLRRERAGRGARRRPRHRRRQQAGPPVRARARTSRWCPRTRWSRRSSSGPSSSTSTASRRPSPGPTPAKAAARGRPRPLGAARRAGRRRQPQRRPHPPDPAPPADLSSGGDGAGRPGGQPGRGEHVGPVRHGEAGVRIGRREHRPQLLEHPRRARPGGARRCTTSTPRGRRRRPGSPPARSGRPGGASGPNHGWSAKASRQRPVAYWGASPRWRSRTSRNPSSHGASSAHSFHTSDSRPPGASTRWSSASAARVANQWKAWAASTRSAAPVRTGSALGGAGDHGRPRRPAGGQVVPHGGHGLDGEDPRPASGEQPGELPAARPELDGEPVADRGGGRHRPRRVGRPTPLVGGDGPLEAAGRRGVEGHGRGP